MKKDLKNDGELSYREKMQRLSLSPRGLCKMGIDAIRVQRARAWSIVNNVNNEDIEPSDLQQVQEHLEKMEFRELLLNLEMHKEEIRNSTASETEKRRMKQEVLDEYNIKYKALFNKEEIPKQTVKNIIEEENTAQQIASNPRTRETIFTPSWNYVPKITPPVISINGVGFLTIENIGVLVATRGYGKSSICESILSNLLNKNCDCLGFEIGEGVQRAVFLDMERTDYDVWNSWRRMIARAEIKEGDETINDKVLFKGLRKERGIENKFKAIEKIIIEFNPQIVMLDTAKSFVPSINDEIKCKQLGEWMERITYEYQCAILTTLHPNKQKETGKEELIGGGWLGRVLEEVSEGVLQVTKDADEIRTITSVKERNTGKQQTAFKFCEEKRMMVSCEKVFASAGRPKNLPLIEGIETDEIKKMRTTIGCNQYKHTKFTGIIKSYIQEELPHLPSSQKQIGLFILKLIELRFIKKTGKQPHTTYEFREDENFGKGKQNQIML